jgi:ATP-dependent Clp protease ATP-binding subunit ClpA
VERLFTPEFRNRLDAVVRFENLPMPIIERIVVKAIDDFRVQLAEKRVTLDTTPELVSWLAEQGYSREFGARNVARLVEDKIKTFFVDEVLFGRLEEGGHAFAALKDGAVEFRVEPLSGEEKADDGVEGRAGAGGMATAPAEPILSV